MEMELDVIKIVEEIAMQAKENQEEFIFETIQPYCENILQMKINKEELKQILLDGMQKQQPCEDCISREEALKAMCDNCPMYNCIIGCSSYRHIEKLPSVKPQQAGWIPVSERMPKDLEPVNITWVNHNPESYYENIKDKPFTATGVYFNGQWYWWSTLCTDILAEYSHNYNDIIDDDIEITAWMPLPQPYKAESEG